MRRLVVLGGSSPFGIALFDALAATPMPPFELILQGRTRDSLALAARAAALRLEPIGWRVRAEADRRAALDGADIVIQQNRFGGAAGRIADEALASRHSIAGDETLGPAALQCVLGSLDSLAALGGELAIACPRAWVLNLTNPLSLTTSLLKAAGVARVVGLCELPLETAREAARRAGYGGADPDWHYAGLNHRGFVFGLASGGRDLFPAFLTAIRTTGFSGASAAEIEAFGAIPTKYFALLTGRDLPRPGRAAIVAAMRDAIFGELAENPERLPPTIRKRGGIWYESAVAPTVAALTAAEPELLVLNLPDADLLTRERQCRSQRGGDRAAAGGRAAGRDRAMAGAARAPRASVARHGAGAGPAVDPPGA